MCETDEPQGRPEGPGGKRKDRPPSLVDSQDKESEVKVGKRRQERSTFAKNLADETPSGRGGQLIRSRIVWSPGPCSAEEPHQ